MGEFFIGAFDVRANIKVLGVGGAGNNAVSNMIERGMRGVEFLAANTDLQALNICPANKKIQLGERFAHGLGVGCDPERGKKACQESLDALQETLEGAEMLFLTAGMGGGTGTGSLPIIAEAAREMGILTVAVVTKPFDFEGKRKMRVAEEWVQKLMETCDSVIVVPNQRLIESYGKMSIPNAFHLANDILGFAVQGITDIVQLSGVMNVDMEDVRTIMKCSGRALMGMGCAEGDDRALRAAQMAISNNLIENTTVKCATGVLVNVTCNPDDMSIEDLSAAVSLVTDEADPDAIIKSGLVSSDIPGGQIRVTVIATGFDRNQPPPAHIEQTAHVAKPVARQRSTPAPVEVRQSATSYPPRQTRSSQEPSQVILPIGCGADHNVLEISDEVTSIPAFIQQMQRKTAAK